MTKRWAFAILFLFTFAPTAAFADVAARSDQLLFLYTQLVSLLRQELALLQDPTQTYLSIYPAAGVAPLSVVFFVHNQTGREGIIYGDGHSTGSNGCMKNPQGYCDLTNPVAHRYQFPGHYTVTLFRHLSADAMEVVSTNTIYVTSPTNAQYNPNQ